MTFTRIRFPYRASAGLAFVASLSLGLASCTIGDEADPDDIEPVGQPIISPPIVHAGFDGQNVYQVPINTDLERFADGQISWESDDEAIVTIAPANAPPFPGTFGSKWALIETKAQGATTIHAIVGDERLSAQVIVTQYDAADQAIGDARYNNGVASGLQMACAACHLVQGGADHTATEIGFHDDAAILQATMMGRYPDVCRDEASRPCDCNDEGCELVAGHVLQAGIGIAHEWELSAEEQQGIVPYLRSLQPNGFSQQ